MYFSVKGTPKTLLFFAVLTSWTIGIGEMAGDKTLDLRIGFDLTQGTNGAPALRIRDFEDSDRSEYERRPRAEVEDKEKLTEDDKEDEKVSPAIRADSFSDDEVKARHHDSSREEDAQSSDGSGEESEKDRRSTKGLRPGEYEPEVNQVRMEGGEWRTSIINQLHLRNKFETAAFQDIIAFQSRLFDNVNTLKNENLQLTLVNERIRYSSTDNGPSGGGGGNNERVQALEQKILVQQEELTNLHRRRGESSQQIINLNTRVHDLEKQLQAKDIIISENTALIASLRAEIQMYETNMTELQGLNQVLRDEHQALQMAFAAIEEKLRKAQDENRSLVDRLIKYKAKDADKMNEENEHFLKYLSHIRKKSDKLRKDLEEAAREGGSRSSGGSPGGSDDKIMESMPFYATTLPTKVALRFDAHDGEVNAVKWSPTDRLVATGGTDRKVKLWDMSKMGLVENKGTLVGSNKGVMSVDFDSSGAYIVGASNDFASRVWSVGDQRQRHTLTGHSGKVMAAKFLGEHTKVITGSHDRTLKVWDLRSKTCTETKFAGSSCNDLVTSDGAGSTIISGHFDKTIRFWDIRTDNSANHILLQGRITSLDLSRDSNYLLACGRDDTIQLIDLRMNTIVRSFSHESFKVGCDWSRAAFGPGGRLLAVGGADGSVYVWNTHSGRLEAILKDHSTAVTAVSWHPQSGLLASVDRSNRAVIWGDL